MCLAAARRSPESLHRRAEGAQRGAVGGGVDVVVQPALSRETRVDVAEDRRSQHDDHRRVELMSASISALSRSVAAGLAYHRAGGMVWSRAFMGCLQSAFYCSLRAARRPSLT